MSARWRTALVAVTALVYLGSTLAFYGFGTGGPQDEPFVFTLLFIVIAYGSFVVFGNLIVANQPRNRIGWIFIAVGCGAMIGNALSSYGDFAHAGGWGHTWHAEFATWFGILSWPAAMGAIAFLFSLFPSGRPSGRVLRVILWAQVIGYVGFFVSWAFDSGQVSDVERPFRNPYGIPALDPVFEIVTVTAGPLFFVASVVAVASLVVKAFRTRGVERQQIKVFAIGSVGLMFLVFLIDPLQRAVGVRGDLYFLVSSIAFAVGISAIPGAAALAILRYRLYDIDVIVNRTLVYGSLTAVLVATYVAAIFGLQFLLGPVTGDSDIAVAAATLLVAGLFGPLRRRVQTFIDRRFYRRRYDAAQTLAAFTSRLRNAVDVDVVHHDVVESIASTLHPRYVSLWVRE